MAKFNVEKFLNDMFVETQSTEGVDAAFARLFSLPAAERKAAGDALEKLYLSDGFAIEGLTMDLHEVGAAALKQAMTKEFEADARNIKIAQLRTQALFNIEKLKGADASPLIKAFVAAAAKLTDEEYNSADAFIKPASALIDALAKSEGLLKPNPLRNNPPQPK